MSEIDRLKQDLERNRDEIRVKMHLASMDAKEEWTELEKKWEHFIAEARVSESAQNVGGALEKLGHELKDAYKRLREAI